MIKTCTLRGPALLAMTGAALAGEVPRFEELDRDGDGLLSRDE